MKRIVIAIVFIWLGLSSYAQVVRYRLSGVAGTVMRGSVIEPWIGSRPVLGGEFAVDFMPTGRLSSLQEYNNASIGLAVRVLDLTNNDILGQAVAPYTYLNVPFVRLPHFRLGIRPGIGLSFVSKTYYNTTTAANRFTSLHDAQGKPIGNGGFGSHTNAFFSAALYMDFPIRDGWTISMAYGWQHISNGSIRQPNSGFNMFNGELGVSYQPHYDTYTEPASRVPRGLYEGKRWDVEMSVAGGLRQAYYKDNKDGDRFFGVAAANISAHYRPWSIFKIGGGIDLFFDDYYRSVCDEFAAAAPEAFKTYFAKTYLNESRVVNCFRVGLSIEPEFVVGNFSLGLHVGVYMFDPVKNLEPYDEAQAAGGKLNRGLFYKYDILNAGVSQDGWIYTQILLKYRVMEHLFVQFGVKSHLTKVEFFNFGIGYAI